MTGALSAFFLSNLKNMYDNQDRLYGWLVPPTFWRIEIKCFNEAKANLKTALPPGREFLVGKFDTTGFWRDASPDLQAVARQWFAVKEDGRNKIVREWLGREMPELKSLADKLFDFKIVRAAKTE